MKLITVGKKTEVNMTEGKIFPLLFYFALPLFLGNIFQQLYNTVDTLVVGQYVGKVSFAAVGTINPIINTLIGFFMGFSSGASVVISKYYGAGNLEKVEDSVHTYVALTLILSTVFTLIGILGIPLMLRIVGSPAEVAAEQAVYLRIYFAGVTGLLIYNMGSAILRAIGNSTYPFIFLVCSALINIVLDLVFVLSFKMGTAGVAYATIIAQGISAVLVIVILLNSKSCVRLRLGKLKLDFSLVAEIFNIGLPSAFQMSITAFSNVFVQSYVNYFGTDIMGGWTAYTKLDHLFFLPMQSLALAATTFVGQNIGKQDIARARRGSKIALNMAFVATIALIIPVVIWAPQTVSLLIDGSETEVIKYGAMFIRLNSAFFLCACVNQVFGGALRGAGMSKIPMFVMLVSFVCCRQVYLFVMTKFIANTPISVAFSYPVGWIICSILMFIYYMIKFPKQEKKI